MVKEEGEEEKEVTIKNYSVDFNNQTIRCQIDGQRGLLRKYEDMRGCKMHMWTMLYLFQGTIKEYEEWVKRNE